jgi:hypothetical protein
MALARVVSFEGVDRERMDELHRRMSEGGPPEGFPPSEAVVLHDAAANRALVMFFLANDDDYAKADDILNAMPTEETLGRRADVVRYDVVYRMSS